MSSRAEEDIVVRGLNILLPGEQSQPEINRQNKQNAQVSSSGTEEQNWS